MVISYWESLHNHVYVCVYKECLWVILTMTNPMSKPKDYSRLRLAKFENTILTKNPFRFSCV